MNTYEVIFPNDFEEYAWELESKGWFDGVIIKSEGKEYKLNFYDPSRLAEDIQEEIDSCSAYFISNLIVIKLLTKENMLKAVDNFALLGQLADFKAQN
jgi:hypothetical protein